MFWLYLEPTESAVQLRNEDMPVDTGLHDTDASGTNGSSANGSGAKGNGSSTRNSGSFFNEEEKRRMKEYLNAEAAKLDLEAKHGETFMANGLRNESYYLTVNGMCVRS